MGTTRRRLAALFKGIADATGKPDLDAVASLRVAAERHEELRSILENSGLDFSNLIERLDADPDLSSLSRRRRIAALIDYVRVAIGLLDQALSARRGHIIVTANDD